MTINLHTLNWEAPALYFYEGLYNVREAYLNDTTKIITAIDCNTNEASIAYVDDKNNEVYDSNFPQEWPGLDMLFTREQWKNYLAELTAQAQEEEQEEE